MQGWVWTPMAYAAPGEALEGDIMQWKVTGDQQDAPVPARHREITP